jgi:probable metal-binding protein
MSQSIHAHQVLNLLAEQPLTIQALTQKVEAEFGSGASFHTCNKEGIPK